MIKRQATKHLVIFRNSIAIQHSFEQKMVLSYCYLLVHLENRLMQFTQEEEENVRNRDTSPPLSDL